MRKREIAVLAVEKNREIIQKIARGEHADLTNDELIIRLQHDQLKKLNTAWSRAKKRNELATYTGECAEIRDKYHEAMTLLEDIALVLHRHGLSIVPSELDTQLNHQ